MPSLAMYLVLSVLMFSVLAPRTVVAQTTWIAPTIEDVNLGVNALLVNATVIQLAIAITFPFRGRSQHIAPGIAATIALLFMYLSYVLYVVFLVVSFNTDGLGYLVVRSQQVIDNIYTADKILSNWTEAALFLTIAFVIRDRYLAYDRKERNGENKSGLPLFPFMIVSYLFVVLMFFLSTASMGFTLSTMTITQRPALPTASTGFTQAATSTGLSFTDIIARNLLYAFVAYYMVATLLLIPMAVVARKKAGSDKIMNVTLFAIIPLLLVRAISRMILSLILSRPSTDLHFLYAIDLASSVVLGIPYFIVVCILCYFFSSLRLWDGPEEPNIQPYHVGGYHQQQPSLQGGMPPEGQFLGQWGYPGMLGQQQQGQVPMNWPHQTYPLQHGTGRHYPNQKPSQQQCVQQQQPVTTGPGMKGRSPSVDEIPQQQPMTSGRGRSLFVDEVPPDYATEERVDTA